MKGKQVITDAESIRALNNEEMMKLNDWLATLGVKATPLGMYSAGELGSYWGWMYNGGANNAEAPVHRPDRGEKRGGLKAVGMTNQNAGNRI